MKLTVTVKDVMKKNVKTIDMNDSINKAAKTMQENRIGSVVVMGQKNVKGIITTRDIVYKHVANGNGKTANDIMSKDLVSIAPDNTIEDAARLMVKKGIEKLIVFDRNKMVGIITSTDILTIQPTLFEILLERMKIDGGPIKEDQVEFNQCQRCKKYSDEVDEVNGVYLCADCR